MPSETSVQVAIVGAGLSGLRAAKEAHDAGLSYVVLEAMDRVGGRVKSTPTNDDGGGLVDEGAAWINDTSQSEMYAMAKTFGFELVQQRAEGNSLYQTRDGKMSLIPFGTTMPMTPEEAEELTRVMGVFTHYIERCNVEDPDLGPDAAYLDSMNGHEFVDKEFKGDNHVAHRLMSTLAQGLVGSEAHEMSALFLFGYIKSGTGLSNMSSDQKNGGQYLRNRAGNNSFATRLAALLRHNSVKLSTPVKGIAQTADGCTLRVGSTGETIVKADRVIITVPPPLYTGIAFEPALPPAKSQLAASTHLGYYSKTILVFSSPWWRHAGLSGILGSETAPGIGPISMSRDTSVPADEQWSITCFILAHKGREWSRLPASERRAAVLRQFRLAFCSVLGEEGVPEPVRIIEKEWSKDPWAGGPATVFGPGTITSDAGKTLREPFERVHFAGTDTALVWKGYMEGAVRAGARAAREVIEEAKEALP